ncbi:DUF418 domain-containing protein [Mangrovimonas sp. YM274]|uniref:DUF418 domain-containing protein n=1 Tax=Mangrovimonas sp. YM274 TaxID=3070660 RepID=UPI0027DDD7C0|nr:DUF418 domain-containing protein [Mangrovimonas sp. YM274]WMI67864.1 DUF418 domain-containing protein [Mangrovimonas sp. YM274]
METTNQTILQPTKSKERINSLDVIRGVALLGILLMNINGMGLPFAYMDPTISGGAEGLNLKAWIMTNMLLEGTMRGLFTLLFGAGVILLTSRLESRGAGIKTADIFYRRLLWLLIFGIINAYVFLWHGDILFHYAVFGLMLFPFRNTPSKKLIIGGLVLISLGVVWTYSEYRDNLKIKKEGLEAAVLKKANDSLTSKQTAALGKWEELNTKMPQEKIDDQVAEMRNPSYWSIFSYKAKHYSERQGWFLYRFDLWDVFSYMLLGMAFFNLRIFHGEKSFKYYGLMALIGYGIGLSVNYYETSQLIQSYFDPIVTSKTFITYDLGRLFTTLGHVGFIMLFIKSGILGFLQKSLAAVGRMALTNYLVHSIIVAFIFLGFGFSLYGQLERHQLYYIVFGIWIAQLIYSPIWLKYFRYGPFEWLWRSLTYQKKQPFRIEAKLPLTVKATES